MTTLFLVLTLNLGAATESGEPRPVVFVCEHGAAKSVVAAALFNDIAAARGLKTRAEARGFIPDAELAKAAVAGLKADGLSLSSSQPRRLEVADLQAAARVITFNDFPAELAGVAKFERWEVPPVSVDYAVAREALRLRIEKLVAELSPVKP